jgi:hypothetical protein
MSLVASSSVIGVRWAVDKPVPASARWMTQTRRIITGYSDSAVTQANVEAGGRKLVGEQWRYKGRQGILVT